MVWAKAIMAPTHKTKELASLCDCETGRQGKARLLDYYCCFSHLSVILVALIFCCHEGLVLGKNYQKDSPYYQYYIEGATNFWFSHNTLIVSSAIIKGKELS